MSKITEIANNLADLKLGQFIHFSSATVQFASNKKVVDWEYGYENRGEERKYPFDPKDWNPTELDCDQWAEASINLGAKFACLTAKHHEGFCLWDTATTRHSINYATCKVDVVREYLCSYRNKGIVAGLYFSMLDIHHNIGRKKCTREDIEFSKEQLKELLTNYGEIPFLIIDGWGSSWGGPRFEDMNFNEMNDFVKSIQPNCIIINHSCETNLDHTEMIFFENNAGQKPSRKFVGPAFAGNVLTHQWFNKIYDKNRRLRNLHLTASKIKKMNKKRIAFLLNMSPNQQGICEDNLIKAYEKIGKMLAK